MASPLFIAKAQFTSAVLEAIKAAFPDAKIEAQDIEKSIAVPKSEMGDLSTSISFRLAKEMKKNPHEIALKISQGARGTKLVSNFTELNGYLNAALDTKAYSELVVGSVVSEKNRYGSMDIGKGGKVIVEFPGVNPNKPWHVGHVRNALLGSAISNILEFCGYSVERDDYIDDLGLQMAESLWGWLNLTDKPSGKFDQWLGEQYVSVNKELEKSEVKSAVNSLLSKLEVLDSKESQITRQMAERCVLAQNETAFSYGVYHDIMVFESDIVRGKLLDKALEVARRKGVLEKPEEGKYRGSTIVSMHKLAKYEKELSGGSEESKVLVRSNGAATYMAKDLAFHMWKMGITKSDFRYKKFVDQPNGKPLLGTCEDGDFKEFGNAKMAVNIIDARQRHEQLSMRAMFSLLGYEDLAKGIIHLPYGTVRIKGVDLSTRKGTWLGEGKNYTADDLLREVMDAAKKIVAESEKITDKSIVGSIANSVALAAIKFDFLKYAPESEITFSWDKALTFEGDTGPYCAYTYARATRVLERGGYKQPQATSMDQIGRGEDFELIKLIGGFAETVERAASEYRPNAITDYLLNIASLFSKFYEAMPILKGGETKEARLLLTFAARQVIGNALALLGISPIERM
ncbi:MAG: arginine--tRNA ligase [Candidatus Micrarchaeota archaeon]|nr:arginine--tRNA ligase [Candidatus Micrarchaeota archaeon]